MSGVAVRILPDSNFLNRYGINSNESFKSVVRYNEKALRNIRLNQYLYTCGMTTLESGGLLLLYVMNEMLEIL